MAGHFVSLILTGMTGVHPSAKLVAVVLADAANMKHGGVAFPSVATLMERTGICETQVRIHLRELEAAGWVSREGNTHGGRGMTTRYRLNLDKLTGKGAADHRVTPVDNSDKGGGAPPGNELEKGVVSDPKGGGAPGKRGWPTTEKGVAHHPRTGINRNYPEVEPRARTPEREPGPIPLHQIVTPFSKGLKTEPEGGPRAPPADLTPEEIERRRRLALAQLEAMQRAAP